MSAADAVTQDRVYRALKADYLAGEFAVGAKLELQPTADRLRSSKTPVREAIHRLIGEQLVEADPGGGFRIWQPTSTSLVHLYSWNAHLLLGLMSLLTPDQLALRLSRFENASRPESAIGLVHRLNSIFLSLADASGNAEAIFAISQINDRLLYTRISEISDVEDSWKELRTLTNLAVVDVQKSMRRRLESYHERRISRQREGELSTDEPN